MNIKHATKIVICMLLLLGTGFVVLAQETTSTTNQGSASTAVQLQRTGTEAIGEAASGLTNAAKQSGTEVVEKSHWVWNDAVKPAFQRMISAFPTIIKALFLLLAFWILARIAGAVVTKLLGLTRLDDHAAHDWGFNRVYNGPKGDKRSIARFAGGIVKWIILLFGFVAFFNALNLDLVAGPLQHVLNRIVEAIPGILKAVVILFVYWVVAAIVRLGLTKSLSAIGFDERVKRFFPKREINGETAGAGAMLARLVFYVILLIGIPPFLEALGQASLIYPLQEMLAKVLGFLPNVVAALIIFYVGRLVATIVREIVVNFLAATGVNAGAEKLGIANLLGEKKLSHVIGFIVYLFILIPIVIAAIDSLQIRALSEPMTNMLAQMLAAVPAILVAAVILVIGYAVARFVKKMVESFLGCIGFDRLPEKLGLSFLNPGEGRATPSSLAGSVSMLLVLLLTAQQALASLGLIALENFVRGIIFYLPNLAVGLVILLGALSLGRFAGKLAADASKGSGYGLFIGAVAKYAIMFLGAGMALSELGVSRDIVTTTVSMVFGAAALAIGLSFGLGGRDRAKEFIDQFGRKQ